MTRPTITTPCAADRHHTGAERIAEFSTSKGQGGLISVREMVDGSAQVSLYRLDKGTVVFCDPEHSRPSTNSKVLDALEAGRRMLDALRSLEAIMATIITEAARSGYRDPTNKNPFPHSSPAWYGFEAGRTHRRSGRTEIIKATMGRGYTVNLETASRMRLVAKFGVALPPIIERKD